LTGDLAYTIIYAEFDAKDERNQAEGWYLSQFPGSIPKGGGLYWSPEAAVKILGMP
jgi:hypothetical protein